MKKKRIYIMRHGKAADYFSYDNDFDRPLVKRGEEEVLAASNALKEYTSVDEIIYSPAKRTEMTARIMAKTLETTNLKAVEDLYLGHYSAYLNAINASGSVNILIIGHNPTIAQLGMQFANSDGRFRTSEILGFEANDKGVEMGCISKPIFSFSRNKV